MGLLCANGMGAFAPRCGRQERVTPGLSRPVHLGGEVKKVALSQRLRRLRNGRRHRRCVGA
jgi:hypothetical protein